MNKVILVIHGTYNQECGDMRKLPLGRVLNCQGHDSIVDVFKWEHRDWIRRLNIPIVVVMPYSPDGQRGYGLVLKDERLPNGEKFFCFNSDNFDFSPEMREKLRELLRNNKLFSEYAGKKYAIFYYPGYRKPKSSYKKMFEELQKEFLSKGIHVIWVYSAQDRYNHKEAIARIDSCIKAIREEEDIPTGRFSSTIIRLSQPDPELYGTQALIYQITEKKLFEDNPEKIKKYSL